MNLISASEPLSLILESPLHSERRTAAEDLFSTTLTGSPRTHQTYRSNLEGKQLPFVIIPAEFELDEFFATVAAYYASRLPLTAYVHVLGKEVAECFEPTQPDIFPSASTMPRSQLALLGAALGETALAAFHSSEGLPNPSYSACKRSLCYVLARAFALYPELEPNLTIERWERLRSLTGLMVSPVALRAVRAAHSAASQRTGVPTLDALPPELQSALSAHIEAPGLNKMLERQLLSLYPGLGPVTLELDGPFDARMGAFLKGVAEIQQATRGAEVDSLTIGYLCNQILPGSFAHSKVLVRLMEFFPTALVWYGLLCSTSGAFDVRSFGSGLIQKLWRDVSQPFSFSQRPTCDIALDELEVLARAVVRADVVKPTQQKIATISLLPGLEVFARFVADDDGQSAREVPANIDTADPRLLRATRLLEDSVALLRELGTSERKALPVSGSKRTKRKS